MRHSSAGSVRGFFFVVGVRLTPRASEVAVVAVGPSGVSSPLLLVHFFCSYEQEKGLVTVCYHERAVLVLRELVLVAARAVLQVLLPRGPRVRGRCY
eukprot:3745203-Rhodomonas_salina.1